VDEAAAKIIYGIERNYYLTLHKEMVMIDFEERAKQNFTRFIEYVNADSRAEKLNIMYQEMGEQLISAPASSKAHYHNAFPGGYLDHVVHVCDASLKVATIYKAIGGHVDFTKQEMIFAALHHDLGKLGNTDGPYYINQDSDWHRKRGELYKHNENIQYMKVTDRSLYLLQQYEIPITEKEFTAIKLSDGMYEDGNAAYLKNYAVMPMKSNLAYIIHWADHMAASAERDATRF
jgi:hypothetical protein